LSTGTASEVPDGAARIPSSSAASHEGGAQRQGSDSPTADTSPAGAAGGLALGPPGSDTRRMAWVPLHGGVVSAASDARRSQQLLHARAAAQQAQHSEPGRVLGSCWVASQMLMKESSAMRNTHLSRVDVSRVVACVLNTSMHLHLQG
jgi:hypothetical protein